MNMLLLSMKETGKMFIKKKTDTSTKSFSKAPVPNKDNPLCVDSLMSAMRGIVNELDESEIKTSELGELGSTRLAEQSDVSTGMSTKLSTCLSSLANQLKDTGVTARYEVPNQYQEELSSASVQPELLTVAPHKLEESTVKSKAKSLLRKPQMKQTQVDRKRSQLDVSSSKPEVMPKNIPSKQTTKFVTTPSKDRMNVTSDNAPFSPKLTALTPSSTKRTSSARGFASPSKHVVKPGKTSSDEPNSASKPAKTPTKRNSSSRDSATSLKPKPLTSASRTANSNVERVLQPCENKVVYFIFNHL